jgi:Phage gp6-like head-tail connector protein
MAYGDLTTLSDVKAWLQTGANPFPSTDDALLARLIAAASEFIQNWLGRPIASADWLEIRDGTGGQLLAFANIPVTAVLSLSIDGITIPPAPTPEDIGTPGFGAGYTFTPTELALRGYVFTRRPQNTAITYTAGYTTVPPDIAQACIELVARHYRERTRIGEMSKALGTGETVTFSQKDMSDSVKTLLSQYRAVAPASGFARRLAPTATAPALLGAAL